MWRPLSNSNTRWGFAGQRADTVDNLNTPIQYQNFAEVLGEKLYVWVAPLGVPGILFWCSLATGVPAGHSEAATAQSSSTTAVSAQASGLSTTSVAPASK
jgi:hypothetical protein